jgi:hypothetical protein
MPAAIAATEYAAKKPATTTRITAMRPIGTSAAMGQASPAHASARALPKNSRTTPTTPLISTVRASQMMPSVL